LPLRVDSTVIEDRDVRKPMIIFYIRDESS